MAINIYLSNILLEYLLTKIILITLFLLITCIIKVFWNLHMTKVFSKNTNQNQFENTKKIPIECVIKIQQNDKINKSTIDFLKSKFINSLNTLTSSSNKLLTKLNTKNNQLLFYFLFKLFLFY